MGKKKKGNAWADALVGSLEAVNAPLVALFSGKSKDKVVTGAATAIGGPAAGAMVGSLLADDEQPADDARSSAYGYQRTQTTSSSTSYLPWVLVGGAALVGLLLLTSGKGRK